MPEENKGLVVHNLEIDSLFRKAANSTDLDRLPHKLQVNEDTLDICFRGSKTNWSSVTFTCRAVDLTRMILVWSQVSG